MNFGKREDQVIVTQLIAPTVPMWAEYQDNNGNVILSDGIMRGWSHPVVCLALAEDYTQSTWIDANLHPGITIEAMIAQMDPNEPIFPASQLPNFIGVSTVPATPVTPVITSSDVQK